MSAVLQLPEPELVLPPDQVFTPGIRTDLANEDYHRIEALSSTGIKRILQSPMHYRWDFLNPDESTTAAKTMGSALHMGILEPNRFDSGAILTIPEDAPNRPTSRTMKAAKPSPASLAAMDYWADFDRRGQGKIVLTEAQAAVVQGMVNSARRHPLYAELFSGGQSEVSYQWTDARLEIPCRCRFDYLRADHLAVDLKSTRDASPEGFARAVASYSYHIQEAHYRNGFEHLHTHSVSGFVFFAIENEAPFGCAIYVLQPNAINFALDRVEAAMLLYAQARKSGYWRGYSEQVQPIVLPRWAVSLPIPTYGNL